jgi:hypothetical protein
MEWVWKQWDCYGNDKKETWMVEMRYTMCRWDVPLSLSRSNGQWTHHALDGQNQMQANIMIGNVSEAKIVA